MRRGRWKTRLSLLGRQQPRVSSQRQEQDGRGLSDETAKAHRRARFWATERHRGTGPGSKAAVHVGTEARQNVSGSRKVESVVLLKGSGGAAAGTGR